MPPAPDPPLTTDRLPIAARADEIVASLMTHQVVVVCGETGSGKTTQLPQILLAHLDRLSPGAAKAGPGMIGHTQPRRLAARSVAARLAEELGEPLGQRVGVKVRFSDQTTARTRIKVMTDGVLLAELGSDPDLRAYRAIIIDEAHERSLNIDFLLGYVRSLLPRRPGLRVVITSATIEPRRFSAYFAGPDPRQPGGASVAAPIIEVSGRTYPIDVRYRGQSAAEEDPARIDYELVADAALELISPRTGGPGDILVFLPGEREIRLARDAITRRGLDTLVLPLFSRLTDQEQDAIFHPAPRGQRRIILATNVAETSLTVPGIRHVVDTGLARLSRYDATRKIQRLPIEPVSQASANQRSGRCGRLGPGICIRLYDEPSLRARPAFTEPEIRRTSLANVILHMKSLGDRLPPIEQFEFLDPPDAASIRDGYETLFELGAIAVPANADADPARADWTRASLTPIGRRLSRLPVDPRIGRMLIASQNEGTSEETLALASVLSIQDPRERPAGKHEDADRSQAVFRHPDSDFLTLLNIWDQYSHASDSLSRGALDAWCRERFLSPARMREWAQTVRQLRSITSASRPDDPFANESDPEFTDEPDAAPTGEAATASRSATRAREDAIHRTLLTGLISNVACREGAAGTFEYRGVRSTGVHLFPGSVLFRKSPKWIMAAELVHTTRLFARTIARIDPEWIEELAGHMFRVQRSDRRLDPATGRARAFERVTMSGIVVVPRREVDIAPTEPAAAREIFLREALAAARWELDAPFMRHNRELLGRATHVEARLRRPGARAGVDAITQWFESRLPREIGTPEQFLQWRSECSIDDAALSLTIHDVIRPEFSPALDQSLYPDFFTLQGQDRTIDCGVEYALAPGKDEDGITFRVPLHALLEITADRLAWLVPGFAPSLTLGLLKTLPKPVRARIEYHDDLAGIADACAAVLTFGAGTPERAIAEALGVLFEQRIAAEDFQRRALPPHLRARVRVVDEAGASLGVDRDLESLRRRFEPRIQKQRAARHPDLADQHGLTDWTFGSLPGPDARTHDAPADGPSPGYPALVDAGDSVSLVRVPSESEAAALIPLGMRRLFALRCREELSYAIDATPAWRDLCTDYSALGSAAELRDAVALIVAGRAFLDAQPVPRSRDEFESRLAAGSARLHVLARDVADVLAPVFEHRHLVAQRLSGGTPRLWAQSVADIREQAAYLMPRRFLFVLPWERLRRYPRYALSMRERLFSLRDEGMSASQKALAIFHPHWKRFTAYVASRMNERPPGVESGPAATPPPSPAGPPPTNKAPLPRARRAAPTVNIDAGEWAIQPGRLPSAMETYRWALEELRLSIFTPDLAKGQAVTVQAIESLWSAAAGDTHPAASPKPKRK
ncbi:MAG: DUF3418 domain-containing protein [Phycisphaerales bacterium]